MFWEKGRNGRGERGWRKCGRGVSKFCVDEQPLRRLGALRWRGLGPRLSAGGELRQQEVLAQSLADWCVTGTLLGGCLSINSTSPKQRGGQALLSSDKET